MLLSNLLIYHLQFLFFWQKMMATYVQWQLDDGWMIVNAAVWLLGGLADWSVVLADWSTSTAESTTVGRLGIRRRQLSASSC